MTEPEKRIQESEQLLKARPIDEYLFLHQILRNQLTLLKATNVHLSWDSRAYAEPEND